MLDALCACVIDSDNASPSKSKQNTHKCTHLHVHVKQCVQQVLVWAWQHREALFVGGENVGGQDHSFDWLSQPSLHLLLRGKLQGQYGASDMCECVCLFTVECARSQ